MARQDIERQKELEPERMDYAIQEIENLGYTVSYKDKTKIIFGYMDHYVTLFPYLGWHTGKSIKDGRGLQKLLNQFK